MKMKKKYTQQHIVVAFVLVISIVAIAFLGKTLLEKPNTSIENVEQEQTVQSSPNIKNGGDEDENFVPPYLKREEISEFVDTELGISIEFPKGWYNNTPFGTRYGKRSGGFDNQRLESSPWGLDEEKGISISIGDGPNHACYSVDDYPNLISLAVGESLETKCFQFTKTETVSIDNKKAYLFDVDTVGPTIEGEAKVIQYLIPFSEEKVIDIYVLTPNLEHPLNNVKEIISTLKFL